MYTRKYKPAHSLSLCGSPSHPPYLPSHLHALLDPWVGDLVVVWGPGGQRDTATIPEKGGPGLGQDDGWVPNPHHTRFHLRHCQFSTPFVFLLGLRVGSSGGAVGSLLRLVLSAKCPMLAYKQL